MEYLGFIQCDDGGTQPLGYGRDKGKYFFTLRKVWGQGCSDDPEPFLMFKCDEIVPLNNTKGTTYIGVRNGNDWGLWRYSEWNQNDSNIIPAEVKMFCGRILEEIRGISANSFEKCLKEYSCYEYERLRHLFPHE